MLLDHLVSVSQRRQADPQRWETCKPTVPRTQEPVMPSTSVHVRLDDPQCSAAPKPLPKLPPSWMDALVTAHVDTIITPVCRQMLRS